MPEFTVKRTCTLKDFLAQSLNISATQAKKLLDARKVFVNGQRVWIASYKLKSGDMIEAISTQCFANAKHPTPANAGAPLDKGSQPKLLKKPGCPPFTRGDVAAGDRGVFYVVEDNEYLIVNKPAGIIVNEHKNSLENKLRVDLKNPHLQAAHRIDKDTSGLVIFAKNPAAFREIVLVFKNFGIEKYYRGIAQGDLLKKFPVKFTLDQPINDRSAETRMCIIKTNALASYFEAQIITGRKHQIRAHLAQSGFPILGENTYQTAKLTAREYRQVPRQMLHAVSIKFTNPISGKILQASAPEPPDFLSTLKLFKL